LTYTKLDYRGKLENEQLVKMGDRNASFEREAAASTATGDPPEDANVGLIFSRSIPQGGQVGIVTVHPKSFVTFTSLEIAEKWNPDAYNASKSATSDKNSPWKNEYKLGVIEITALHRLVKYRGRGRGSRLGGPD